MTDLYTKPVLVTRTMKISDEAWYESTKIVKRYNMSREHYVQLANKLVKEYFDKEGV